MAKLQALDRAVLEREEAKEVVKVGTCCVVLCCVEV